MSVPPIAKATFQAVVINAGSNVLAQVIKSYRDQVRFAFSFHFSLPFTFPVIRDRKLVVLVWQFTGVLAASSLNSLI